MDYVICYEIVAAVILFIIAMCYRYRMWVAIKRNQYFYHLLLTMLVVIAADIVGRAFVPFVHEDMMFWAMSFAALSNIGTFVLCAEVSAYYFVMVRCREKFYLVLKKILELFMILLIAGFLTNQQTHFLFWYDENFEYHIGYGMYFVLVVSELFLLLGISIVLKRPRNFQQMHQWIAMVSAAVLIMVVLPMQYLNPTGFRLIFYVFSSVTIIFYLVFHLSDQFMRKRMGTFSRVSMRQYIEECEIYQKDFCCVALNIINMYSIRSIYSEEEMRSFDMMIGKNIQTLSRKCVVYQSNESEYILIAKDKKVIENNCRALQREMPHIIRINGKNVSVNYGYYILSFAEASHSEGIFYRIAAGMRRVAGNMGDGDIVLRYQGKLREALQKELQGLQAINEVIEAGTADFDLEFMPIYSVRDGAVKELEVFASLALADGTDLDEGQIWKLMAEQEHDKEIAVALWTEIADFVQKQKIFEQDISLLHINVSPRQVSSRDNIDRLCRILEDREIRPEQIVLEIFADQSVPEDILRENTQYMREQGFHVLLDQFGINICNLKNILNMPFDQAKFNMQMMERLIQDKKDELRHLVNMLRKQGWEIYADGAYSSGYRKKALELGIDGVQGESIASRLTADTLVEWLQQEGGRLS